MIKKLEGPGESGKTHYWFTICARNGQVLATSETYKTKRARDKGVKSLLKNVREYNTIEFL